MLNILDEYSIPYRIVDYKGDTRDPDEIYHQDGKDALLRLLTSLITKSQFVLNYYSKGNDFETTESKTRFLLDILPSYNSLKEELWEGVSDNYSYKATFGTWTTLYHKLL